MSRVAGADPKKLQEMVTKIGDAASATEGSGSGGSSSSSGASWLGAGLPKGYGDVTSQIDHKGCELLNADDDAGPVRVLFDSAKPSALTSSSSTAASGQKDWIESGADDQLLLFLPFQSVLKLHTIQVGSRLPALRHTNTFTY